MPHLANFTNQAVTKALSQLYMGALIQSMLVVLVLDQNE